MASIYDELHNFDSTIFDGGSSPYHAELNAVPKTLGFPRTPDMASPEQKADAYQQASAAKQGGTYDPNTRTMTLPDKSGQRAPQGGSMAGGSNVFIPSDPNLRINAGGGAGASAPIPLEGPMTVGNLTGNVRDRVTGQEMSSAQWDDQYQGRGTPNDWISGGDAFKAREDDAMSMAASAMGVPMQKRGVTGDYTSPGYSKQTLFARNIMQHPDVEKERLGLATSPFVYEGMSDAEVLDASNGSVLYPATEQVSMGTNFRKPDLAGVNAISSFESRYGTLPQGIPYDTRDENTRLVQDLMPSAAPKTPGSNPNNLAKPKRRK